MMEPSFEKLLVLLAEAQVKTIVDWMEIGFSAREGPFRCRRLAQAYERSDGIRLSGGKMAGFPRLA